MGYNRRKWDSVGFHSSKDLFKISKTFKIHSEYKISMFRVRSIT